MARQKSTRSSEGQTEDESLREGQNEEMWAEGGMGETAQTAEAAIRTGPVDVPGSAESSKADTGDGRTPHVRDVMTQHPMLATRETPLEEVAREMVDADCGAIPIVEGVENPRPIGIITDRDIVARAVALGKNPHELKARDCMTESVVTVEPDDDVADVAFALGAARVRRGVVIDEGGAVVGMIAQADIVKAAPWLAAELLGAVSQPTHVPSVVRG